MNLSDIKTKSHKNDHKIAIGIDYPNIEIGLKEAGWLVYFDYEVIENYAKMHGEIVMSKVYGDWVQLKRSAMFLSQYDVELVHVPHVKLCGDRKKDTVDTKMAMDFGMMLYEFPEVDMVIIVSGDADFISVVTTLKQYKTIEVYVIGERESMSNVFGKVADQTLFYQYIADLD